MSGGAELLARLGSGVLLAFVCLPVLARCTRLTDDHPPDARLRAGVMVLALSSAYLLLPFARSLVPLNVSVELGARAAHSVERVYATPVSGPVPLSPFGFVGGLWVLLCAGSWMRLGVGALGMAGIRRRAGTAPAGLTARLSQLALEARVVAPRLGVSPEVESPCLVGVVRPMILVPPGLLAPLSEERLVWVLRHELVHLERSDLGTQLVASLLGTLFPLHPTARRLEDELRQALEQRVDGQVSATDPSAYASVLLDLSETRLPPLPVLSMSTPSITRRIQIMLRTKPFLAMKMWPVMTSTAVLLGLGLTLPGYASEAPATEAAASVDAQDDLVVELKVGETREMDALGVRKVSIADPSVVEVRNGTPGHLRLEAIAPGKTTMILFAGASRRTVLLSVR